MGNKITKTGDGKVETYIYYIGNEGTNRLYNIHIASLKMLSGTEKIDAKYYGKAVEDGKSITDHLWGELEATSREDALEEMKQLITNAFTKGE